MKALIDAMKSYPLDGHYQTYARGIRRHACAVRPARRTSRPCRTTPTTCSARASTAPTPTTPRVCALPPRRSPTPAAVGTIPTASTACSASGRHRRRAVDRSPQRLLEGRRATTGRGASSTTAQWGYVTGGGGAVTMTCAGIASLLVAHEYLDPPLTSLDNPVGREPFSPTLTKGLDWCEQGDHSRPTARRELVGLHALRHRARGAGVRVQVLRHARVVPRAGAAAPSAGRTQYGSWGGLIDTSYTLLFLARGRHPMLMNKLRFDGKATSSRLLGQPPARRRPPRPLRLAAARAAAQLAGRPDRRADGPTGPTRPSSTSPATRRRASAPRTTTSSASSSRPAGCSSPTPTRARRSSTRWAADLAHQLFRQYEMADLPADHPIYNIVFKTNPRPPLKAVTNGSRILMLHSPADLACAGSSGRTARGRGGRPPRRGR